ncbi:MAG: DoxX family protein [Candidatus Omnitrophota bacterium]
MGSARFDDVAIFILRVTVGAILLAHGLQKLLGAFGGPGIQGTATMLSGMGFAPAEIWAWVLALGESLGGLFLILGILPKLSALAIAIVMIVAIVRVHGPKGFFMMKGGFEYPLLILSVCITIMITGAGKYSLFNKL